jgi:DNA replication protein DnaC
MLEHHPHGPLPHFGGVRLRCLHGSNLSRLGASDNPGAVHVLVIDELGYQSYAADAANVLFRVVSIRHLKRRSTLMTTNKPLAALGQVLHDADLAEAILDRLLERDTHFVLRGRSYRTCHQKEDLSSIAESDAA